MGRSKRRRSSSSSTTSSSSGSTSSSSSNSDCAGRYRRNKKNRKNAGTTDTIRVKSKKRPSRADVHNSPKRSKPTEARGAFERDADLALAVPSSLSGTHSGGPTGAMERESSVRNTRIRRSVACDADVAHTPVLSNSPRQTTVSTVESQQQRIGQLEDLVNQLLQNESDKHYTKLTVNPNCIPEFNPSNENESCARWLDKIDQLAHINQWDDKVVIYHMQNRLAGLAKTWYNNLDDYRHSWDQWKQLLIQVFPDHQDFPSNLKNLIFRVKSPEETWTEYYFAKQQLLRQCQITGKNAVAMIIDGIPDMTTQSGAKVGRYASAEDLYHDYLSTLENTRHRRVNQYTKPDFFHKTDKNRAEHPKPNHHKYDSKRNSRGKCYNCGEFGHMQTHCPKERLECTLCKKLGHSAEKCFRNKNNRPKSHEHKTLICDTQEKSKTNGYYVDCSINGYFLKGFIDSGCEIVTIRATDAKMVGLSWIESEVCLNGYGGATSKVLGITKVNLKVDLFDSDVSVYVVPDHLQTMAILIGRSILSNPNAITVVKNGSARLFSTKVADLPEIDELPTKITFRTKQKVEIPPHHVGFVTCSTTDKFHGDVFVDKRQSFQPWKEYVIPSCVTSTKGNCYLLVVICAFTKFLFAKAVKSTQTKPVINFLESILRTFGVPRRIIADRGSAFTSTLFTNFTKELGVKLILNATTTPRANGQVERYNRTLLNAISSRYDDETKWDTTLDHIVFSINSVPHSITKKSPSELLLGYHPRAMNDSFLSNVVTDVADEAYENVQKTRNETGERIRSAQAKQKAYFDAKRKKSHVYGIGDLVLIRRTNVASEGKSKKLVPKFSGPYAVKKVLEHDRDVVEDLPGSRRARKAYQGIWSADKMKPFMAAYENSSDTDTENEVVHVDN
nr:unnamed protein product [Callosobruchus chinensis]